MLESNSTLTELLQQVQENVPVKLCDLKISESDRFESGEELKVMEDSVGNIYSPGNLYKLTPYHGKGYASYYANGEYTRITGTIAVADDSSKDTGIVTVYDENEKILYTNGRNHQNNGTDRAHDGTEDHSRYNIHNPVPPLQRHVEQVSIETAEAHKGQAGDGCCDRVMGRPLKGAGGSQASTRLRTPLNMTMASIKPQPAADGADQSLDVSVAEAVCSHIGAVVAHDPEWSRPARSSWW